MKKWNVRACALALALLTVMTLLSCAKGGTTPSEPDKPGEPEQVDTLPTLDRFDAFKQYALPNYDAMDMKEYVKLGRCRGLTLTLDADSIRVTDAQVEQMITSLLEQHPNAKVTDRAVAWGDTVIVDYMGKKDGVAFSGGTAYNRVIAVVEPNTYIPGFVEGLVGVMPGVPTDVPMTFPENYGVAELAGQDVVFTFTVSYIKEVPELTDDFVAILTEGALVTVDAYRADVRAQMEKLAYDEAVAEQLWSSVFENAAVLKYPEDAVMYYYSNMYQTYSYYASSYGLDFATYLSYMGGTPQMLFEACMQKVKEDMVYRAVLTQGGYTHTDEQYKAALSDYTDQMYDQLNSAVISSGGSPLSWEQAYEYFATNYQAEISLGLLQRMATEDLLEDADVKISESEE